MAQFYGMVSGGRGTATRLGHKQGGLSTTAASYSGAIKVRLWHDEKTGKDMYEIQETRWQGAGRERAIARGAIGETE